MTISPAARSHAPSAEAVQLASAGAQFPGYRIAAIVPCHNEEAAIGKVVADLVAAVPDMDVFVYDNCSTDNTVAEARRAGAIVRRENLKGKGNVVRRAFADIDADIYLLIDGDDTYDAAAAPAMIQTLLDGPYDHLLGIREPESTATTDVYRGGHERGNRILNRVVAKIFGTDAQDMLSGYRVFSRRFVKSFPAMSREFEIETELTVHYLAHRLPATTMKIGFRDRPAGSESKLRTYHDGFRILNLILSLTRHERPMAFFGALAALVTLVGGAASLNTGLTGGIAGAILGGVMMVVGVVLDGVRKSRHAHSRLAYLGHAAVPMPVEARPAATPAEGWAAATSGELVPAAA